MHVLFVIVILILGHINALTNISFSSKKRYYNFFNKLFTHVKEMKFIQFVELRFIQPFTVFCYKPLVTLT